MKTATNRLIVKYLGISHLGAVPCPDMTLPRPLQIHLKGISGEVRQDDLVGVDEAIQGGLYSFTTSSNRRISNMGGVRFSGEMGGEMLTYQVRWNLRRNRTGPKKYAFIFMFILILITLLLVNVV